MVLLVPLHPARQPHLGLQPLLLAHLVLLVMLVLLANPTLVFQSQCSRRLLQSRPPSTEEASIQWKPILARQSSTAGAMSWHWLVSVLHTVWEVLAVCVHSAGCTLHTVQSVQIVQAVHGVCTLCSRCLGCVYSVHCTLYRVCRKCRRCVGGKCQQLDAANRPLCC